MNFSSAVWQAGAQALPDKGFFEELKFSTGEGLQWNLGKSSYLPCIHRQVYCVFPTWCLLFANWAQGTLHLLFSQLLLVWEHKIIPQLPSLRKNNECSIMIFSENLPVRNIFAKRSLNIKNNLENPKSSAMVFFDIFVLCTRDITNSFVITNLFYICFLKINPFWYYENILYLFFENLCVVAKSVLYHENFQYRYGFCSEAQ